MEKFANAGAAPVSKYAAKKFGRVLNGVKTEKVIVDTETTPEVVSVEANKPRIPKKPIRKSKGIPDSAQDYPPHFVAIALLCKNNTEIRRFTSLGILNYLLQKGEIKGKSRYVSFKWNKFAVKCDGLMREYSYNEPFFLNALVASFTSFSASAQRVINDFCKKEMSINIDKACDQDEVNDIVAMTEKYLHDKENSDKDIADEHEDFEGDDEGFAGREDVE